VIHGFRVYCYEAFTQGYVNCGFSCHVDKSRVFLTRFRINVTGNSAHRFFPFAGCLLAVSLPSSVSCTSCIKSLPLSPSLCQLNFCMLCRWPVGGGVLYAGFEARTPPEWAEEGAGMCRHFRCANSREFWSRSARSLEVWVAHFGFCAPVGCNAICADRDLSCRVGCRRDGGLMRGDISPSPEQPLVAVTFWLLLATSFVRYASF
jgi:hypothetical protein